jgi:hypothetical protein
MTSRGIALAVLVLAAVVPLAGASSQKQPTRRISNDERIEIIRSLNAEHVFARTEFPMGRKGLGIKAGNIVSPTASEMQQLLADNGPSVKPGDRAQITNILFKDNVIRFEINGGPQKRQKWYQRIQVGGMGGMTPVARTDPNTLNARGSYVDLIFDKAIPSLTPEQVRQMLMPVLDFNAHSAAEAYLKTLSPKVQQAIKDHRVLVGMNHEMVDYAKGRPPRKVREKDENNRLYEEFIYGEPPQDVEFIRFIGDEVVQVKTMKVDGEKIVRTQREVELKPQPSLAQNQQQEQEQPQKQATRPSLRRPGEDDPAVTPSTVALPPVNTDPKHIPNPGSGPGDTPDSHPH